MQIKGHAWKFGANVDTDVIIPVRYLTSMDPTELGKHCLEGLDSDFSKKVQPGNMIVAPSSWATSSTWPRRAQSSRMSFCCLPSTIPNRLCLPHETGFDKGLIPYMTSAFGQ